MLIAYFMAQHINQQSGGAVVAPWEIEPGHTLDEWAEAALALSRAPSLKARQSAVEKVFENVRKGNKHYSALSKRRIH